RLFQPFSQVDASMTRRYGGTGLGLMVSKRLAELMGGAMWVESAPGEGSTFHFTVQVTALPETSLPTRKGSQPELRGRRLLIVDDNATNRHILVLQTQTWGMLARDTGSPHEALAWIARGDPFDVAILDMQMPEQDGKQLGAAIRRLRDARSLPLVLFSSLGHRESGVGPEDFQAYLTKPLKQSQLFDTLMTIFGTEHPEDIQRPIAPVTPAIAPMAHQHPLRILLAEDNPMNQQLALLLLERLGYQADVACNGVEAIAAMERVEYDVVLMDVQMPELDGLEATRQICARWTRDRRPRIVAMTANAMHGDREECLAAGMDDYVSKPIRVEELTAALERSSRRCSPTEATSPRVECQPARLSEIPALIHVDTPCASPEPVASAASAPSSRSPSLRAPATLDLATLERLRVALSRGPAGALDALVETFLTNAPELIPAMRRAIADENAVELRRAAHTLKSNAVTFGALALGDLCRDLEVLGRGSSVEGAAPLLVEVSTEYSRVRDALIAALRESGHDG
ncbi:MAG: response regulator, partial [Chloroflexi bacterium]|nr:response regulator [Chloroflexota bacterium]